MSGQRRAWRRAESRSDTSRSLCSERCGPWYSTGFTHSHAGAPASSRRRASQFGRSARWSGSCKVSSTVAPLPTLREPRSRASLPHAVSNEVHPCANEAHPDARERHPDARAASPDANGAHPRRNEAHPGWFEARATTDVAPL